MNMTYKLAVFDMDGTILDTLQDLADSTNHALAYFNLPQRSKEEIRTFVGNGMHKLIERAVPENSEAEMIEAVFSELHNFYEKHCADTTKPYDGILEMLKGLRARGIFLAVVSNKADYAVKSLCEIYFKGLFDFACGDKEGQKRKPHPDMVNAALVHFNLTKDEAVYIGDSEVDLQTAVNSGLFPIMVAWGFKGEKFLKEHGAENIVYAPEEILGYF